MESNTKYTNHIFLTICEITLSLHKTTKFSSHTAYLQYFSECFKHNDLNLNFKNHLFVLITNLNKLFYLTDEQSMEFIDKFLNDKDMLKFQKVVNLTNEFYEESGKIY